MSKQIKKIEVEVLKLKDALAVSANENATDEEVRAAYLTLRGFFNKISEHYTKIKNRVEAIDAGKQMEMELVFSNSDGDSASVLTEEVTHSVVDMVGIHKDAQAQVTASYSDPIYEQVFKPMVRAKKADVIRLANEGVLPNANQRVKTVTYHQTKLFDYKEVKEDK